MCKSASSSRQITKPAPHYSVFYRPDALPAAQPTASKALKVKALLYITKMKSNAMNIMANMLLLQNILTVIFNQCQKMTVQIQQQLTNTQCTTEHV